MTQAQLSEYTGMSLNFISQLEGLGKVDAERFISLIIKEPFDYTKWQHELFDGMSVRELSNAAMNAVNE